MDVAYSAFLKQVSLELPTSASFDDGPFRVFRHFEFNARKHFSFKKISPVGFVHPSSIGRLAFIGHVSCWVSIAMRLAHTLFLEGHVGCGWRLEG